MKKDNFIDNYYKAYDKRYGQVYEEDMLWSSKEHTEEVVVFLKRIIVVRMT